MGPLFPRLIRPFRRAPGGKPSRFSTTPDQRFIEDMFASTFTPLFYPPAPTLPVFLFFFFTSLFCSSSLSLVTM